MRIREAEEITGLTRKSIRFYEEKGLLGSVSRSENTYREYSEADIERLRTIAVLRGAGVSLSDIQLWQDAVITAAEMLNKRLGELRDSAGRAAGQVTLCRRLLDSLADGRLTLPHGLPDGAGAPPDEDDVPPLPVGVPLACGIDIGTTTVSAVVLEPVSDTQLGVYTVSNDNFIPTDCAWEKTQRPDGILTRVRRLLSSLVRRYPDIACIGLSGQMHGILYLDAAGQPLSPLYTWQDGRAGQGSPSACERIRQETGYAVSPGYGLATAYHQLLHGEIPAGAACLCTVMDYVGMALCGLDRPLMHATNAASLGFFTPGGRDFDRDALKKLGFPLSLLPAVTTEPAVLGRYGSIPVSAAIGDNQAGFLGSVTDPAHTALANFGTGSQISMLSETPVPASGSIETRPYADGQYLLSGSALCGGRAYRLLERFFASYAAACGQPPEEQYEVLNKLAVRGLSRPRLPSVRTTFCGTRDDPTLRGSFTDIGEEDFTPDAFAAGVLIGMAEELHAMFERMPHEGVTSLVASGNAARLNPALLTALSRVFSLPVTLPAHTEEAACGAALSAWRTCAGAAFRRGAPVTISKEDTSV